MDASTPQGVLILPIYPPDRDDLGKFSHLGGLPSLPQGYDWPRAPNGAALHFLAQIDLAKLPAGGVVDFRGDPLRDFPREGAIYFFADCATYGLWEQPDAAHRVIYAPSCQNALPVQPPRDLAPHNAPEAGVLANTHHPGFPRLSPRPMVLLPHVPISLIEISPVTLPCEEPPHPPHLHSPWTGHELHGDWSRMPLLDTGFPWRWLCVERLAISLYEPTKMAEWPRDIQVQCVGWAERASIENPLGKIPKGIVDEFRKWLQDLATRDSTVRYYSGLKIKEAIHAAWPYIAFSGDTSDLPPEAIEYWRPIDRPTITCHHKMFGDAVSVQAQQLADEDNVLLLRLESDDALDFCWGDVGILQITVPRTDLAARNFQRTALNADCG
jgi:hypothetical protein